MIAMGQPSTEVQDLLRLTNETVDDPGNDAKHLAWWSAVQAATQETLIRATSRVESTPVRTNRAAIVKARREAMISEVDRRNAAHVAQTMKDLDAAAGKLSWVGLVLAFISAIAAIPQLIQLWSFLK